MFVGQAGNDPRNAGGQSSVSRFPILSTGTGFTSFDGDTCGDYIAAGVETWRIDNVQVRCEGEATTGLLAVPYLLSYQQNNPGVCNADSSLLLAPGSPSKCNSGTATVPTLVVRGYVRVTKQTVPDGAAGSFAFTAGSSLGTPSPTAFNLSDNQSQLVEVNVTGTPRTLTINEALLPGWESGANIVCTNPSGGAAPYVTVDNATRTITASLDTVNFGAECTITNTRLPTVTLTKVTQGGVGTFGFSGNNGFAAQNITTVTPGVPVAGATQSLTAASTLTTITEAALPGFALTAASCTGLGPGGTATPNLAARTVTLDAAATASGANIACTFTNTRLPTVTISKNTVGGVGTFGFSGSNGFAAQNITTVTPGVPVAGATQTLTAASTLTTITEAAVPGFALTSATCTGLGAGGTATPNLAARTVTLDAAATASGANIACTFTNSRLPTVTISKNTVGGVGTFGFSGSNGFAAQNITTVTPGTPVSGATQTLTAASTLTTITEAAPPAGFALTAVSCTGLGSGGTATPNLATRTVTLDAAATAFGADIACTFTNTRLPTVTIVKNTLGGVGTFGFSGSNGIAAQNITTVTPGVPVAGATQTLTAASTGTTITEDVPPPGFALTAINCTGLGSGGLGIQDFGTRTVSLNALATAPGADITCTFTNTRQPVLRVQKTLPSGRFVAADQFTLTIAGSGGPATVTTAGSGTTATGTAVLSPATVGAAYTLSEVGASGADLANYAATWSCANSLPGGQTPSGSGTSFNVVPVAGDDLTCTFTNARNALADLRLTKTNTPGANGEVDQAADSVVSGASTTYTITATNFGPDAANGALLTDPAPTGLTCTTASCTAAGGASCPAPTGAALVAALQGAGAVIPTLPNGGSVAIALTCTVD